MRLGLLIVWLLAAPAAFAGPCHFEYDPISTPTYYRTEGWNLPGITDVNSGATPRFGELPSIKPVPGAIAEVLPHEEYPYIVEFPAQEFVLNGRRQKMRTTQAKVGMVRWKVDGRIIAYSYGLIPVAARRVSGMCRANRDASLPLLLLTTRAMVFFELWCLAL